jgi:hypothetical protein
VGYYYQTPSSDDERPGCRDTLLITRAVFAVLIPPLAAMFALLALVFGVFIMLAIAPWLALIPIALIVAAVLLFAHWARGRTSDARDL